MRTIRRYGSSACAPVALVLAMAIAPARAGDPSSAVAAVADAPPETQVRILKVVLGDVFGSRAELKEKFVAACAMRQVPAPVANKPAPPVPLDVVQQKAGELSRDAVLAVLCTGPARRQVEAALTPPAP